MRLSRLLFLVKVKGKSMEPELLSGNVYFATNLFPAKAGDFIVFHNPDNSGQILVKKASQKTESGYLAQGICPDSFSSRNFGIVTKNLVLGKILI